MSLRRRRGAALLCAAAFTLLGCEGCHDHDPPHGDHAHGEHEQDHGEHDEHSHAQDAIGITRFTDKLELFAEHPPAVTGRELPFLAHLTILDGFEPLEQGSVTLVLDGPARVEARVDKMLRSGIFQPTFDKAPKPGTYQASLVVKSPDLEDVIAGFEIVVHPNAEAAKKASASSEEQSPEPIRFLKEQQWQLPFGTAFAIEDSVVPTIEVAGEVTTPPSGQADVGAAITGRVVAPHGGLPKPGTSVKAGTLLATIAPAPAAPETAARADLAVVEAEARVEAARAALARAERLIADKAVSERDVEEARRELTVAESAVTTAKRARAVFAGAASGRGAGTYLVTSPIDGVVVEVHATEGKSVTGGDPLFRVVKLDDLWIEARVPEQEAAKLRSDQDAAFKLPGLDEWLPLDVTGDQAAAAVVNIGRTVDRRSRTVDVIYALSKPDERLRVGAMVRVAVPAGAPWRGVVVPRSAVLDDDGRSVIYVQVEGEAFEERSVRLGPRSAAMTGIESGVRAGERVVTKGANVIRLSSRAGSAPAHGHVH